MLRPNGSVIAERSALAECNSLGECNAPGECDAGVRGISPVIDCLFGAAATIVKKGAPVASM
jgi:hypothetical protein